MSRFPVLPRVSLQFNTLFLLLKGCNSNTDDISDTKTICRKHFKYNFFKIFLYFFRTLY